MGECEFIEEEQSWEETFKDLCREDGKEPEPGLTWPIGDYRN